MTPGSTPVAGSRRSPPGTSTTGSAPPTRHGTCAADHDRHTHRELATLLGAGHATIRTGPAAFTRVDDLDLELTAEAGAVVPG